MMKRFFLFCFLAIAVQAMAVDYYLYQVSTSGATQRWKVDSVQSLTFNGSNLVVTPVVGVPVTEGIADIRDLYFGYADGGSTDLVESETVASQQKYIQDGHVLLLSGNDIFSVDGRRLGSRTFTPSIRQHRAKKAISSSQIIYVCSDMTYDTYSIAWVGHVPFAGTTQFTICGKTYTTADVDSIVFTRPQGLTPQDTCSLVLSPSSLNLKVGDMGTIRYTGNSGMPTWTVSDTSVCSVIYGIVSAKAIGKAILTVTDRKGSVKAGVYVTGSDGSTLRLTPGQVTLDKGQTFQMSVGNTFALPVTWSSSDESIATVDQNGLVTAVGSGNALITLSTAAQSVQALVAVRHNWGPYQLVWSDEFNGSSLNTDNWNYNTGAGGWGNNEAQYYTDRTDNVKVEDGCLVITAKKEDYGGASYTSGRIHTRDKQMFTYGKIEASISLPDGGGLWPAFWMLGKGNWPAAGECDIMEYVGNVPGRVLGTLHTTRDRDGAKSGTAYWLSGIENTFHTYGVEWCKEELDGRDVIRFYVDGHVFSEQYENAAQIDNTEYWPFSHDMYIIFNMAVGGNLGGSINDDVLTAGRQLKVDWVRVYQRSEQ